MVRQSLSPVQSQESQRHEDSSLESHSAVPRIAMIYIYCQYIYNSIKCASIINQINLP